MKDTQKWDWFDSKYCSTIQTSFEGNLSRILIMNLARYRYQYNYCLLTSRKLFLRKISHCRWGISSDSWFLTKLISGLNTSFRCVQITQKLLASSWLTRKSLNLVKDARLTFTSHKKGWVRFLFSWVKMEKNR